MYHKTLVFVNRLIFSFLISIILYEIITLSTYFEMRAHYHTYLPIIMSVSMIVFYLFDLQRYYLFYLTELIFICYILVFNKYWKFLYNFKSFLMIDELGANFYISFIILILLINIVYFYICLIIKK